mmetsp:Transcript_12744/g.40420  ORF Transcript_12744/g.40420 Transcript_12744/m.40420 type:complete len:258 (+) Transcript_12744:335-1108(+)
MVSTTTCQVTQNFRASLCRVLTRTWAPSSLARRRRVSRVCRVRLARASLDRCMVFAQSHATGRRTRYREARALPTSRIRRSRTRATCTPTCPPLRTTRTQSWRRLLPRSSSRSRSRRAAISSGISGRSLRTSGHTCELLSVTGSSRTLRQSTATSQGHVNQKIRTAAPARRPLTLRSAPRWTTLLVTTRTPWPTSTRSRILTACVAAPTNCLKGIGSTTEPTRPPTKPATLMAPPISPSRRTNAFRGESTKRRRERA